MKLLPWAPRPRVLLTLLLAAVLLPFGFAALPASAAVPPNYQTLGPGDTYLALGDSLATGYEEPGNADGQPGYPARLLDYLKSLNADIEYKNLGREGEDSGKMLIDGDGTPQKPFSQLQEAENFIAAERAKGRQVGLITLNIGGNDIVKILPPPVGSNADPGATLATYRTNLEKILARLQAALTVDGQRTGDILLMDHYNAYPGFKLPLLVPEPLADIWVPQFSAALKDVAAARGIPVAEVAQAFTGREVELIYVKRGPNGEYSSVFQPEEKIRKDFDFHPRPAGHLVIAEEFVKVSGYQAREATHLAFVTR